MPEQQPSDADRETADTELSHNGRQERGPSAAPSRRKALMPVNREFLVDAGWTDIDPLKWCQRERNRLCSALKLPDGTVLLDARWDALEQETDRLVFLITHPEFPEVEEGHQLPRVNACFKCKNWVTKEPYFSHWEFSRTWGVPLEQCEWFRKIPKRSEATETILVQEKDCILPRVETTPQVGVTLDGGSSIMSACPGRKDGPQST